MYTYYIYDFYILYIPPWNPSSNLKIAHNSKPFATSTAATPRTDSAEIWTERVVISAWTMWGIDSSGSWYQWVDLGEDLNRKPLRFSHEIQGIFL